SIKHGANQSSSWMRILGGSRYLTLVTAIVESTTAEVTTSPPLPQQLANIPMPKTKRSPDRRALCFICEIYLQVSFANFSCQRLLPGSQGLTGNGGGPSTTSPKAHCAQHRSEPLYDHHGH